MFSKGNFNTSINFFTFHPIYSTFRLLKISIANKYMEFCKHYNHNLKHIKNKWYEQAKNHYN